jgi:hypothetical protein
MRNGYSNQIRKIQAKSKNNNIVVRLCFEGFLVVIGLENEI